MRRLFKLYRYILICMVLATLVLSFVAWYTVGVVELHGAIDEIDANISDMADTIDQNAENKTMLETELTDDYKSKTRVLAMLLDSSLTEESIDDKTLEELRVGIGADLVSVSDAQGHIILSTDLSSAGTTIAEPFLNHIHEIVYTDVGFRLEDAKPVIQAASTLGNGHGMVQVSYSASTVQALLQKTEIQNLAADMPLYGQGSTAIVDLNTMCFLSHTDPDKINQTSVFNSNNFQKKKGRIDTEIDGTRQMVRYQVHDEQVLMAMIPFSELYQERNTVVGWMLGGGAVLLVITVLAMRMQWIFLKREMELE